MKDFNGIPEDSDVAAGRMRSKEDLQDDMVFRLDPLVVMENKDDDPMWSSSSSMPEDWFFTGE